jgi:hypothetical protein
MRKAVSGRDAVYAPRLSTCCSEAQEIKDGYTYLAVMDDNGGKCGPIKMDGKIWPYPIGQAGRVEPGSHTIECGGSIQFNVPKGILFKFDYWGP